jgi:hypothetical protein
MENTSASAVTINSLAYTGEQWRKGGVTDPHVVTLWYRISPTAITDLQPNVNTDWTALSAGDFSSPINTSVGAALDGNDTANRTAITIDPNINVPSGNFVMIRWSDPDHTGADHGLAIDDVSIAWVTNSSPSLTVTAPLDIFSESSGPNASVGTVTIPAALGTDLVVSLVSSDPSEATVPATVTIPAGQTSATFNISAVNDLLADGSQAVIISATASGYLGGQKSLSVEDDFDAPISVSVIPSSFNENAGPEAATGTLTIAENTLVDLTVNLISTDITEATVPASVIIPAGKNTVDFKVAAQDDADLDGDRTVSIQVSATGYTGSSTLIQVLDFGDTAPVPTLPVNAIAFTGYNAEGSDNLAFVALVPIAAGDMILFSDNEWDGGTVGSGGGFTDSNEGLLTWTAPAEGVAAGTIVTLDGISQSSWTASVGSITASDFALATGGDTVYAFQGVEASPQRVLAAISANTDIITGTGLTEHVVLATGTDIGAYKGSRGNQPAFTNYLAQINNVAANWVTQDTGANDGIDAVAPDVPFSTTPFTLGTGDNFSSWIAGFQVGGLTGPNDDFDNDGLDNMVENILGSDPSVGNAGLNTVSGTPNSVTFQHTLADSPPPT